jgi:hypothetical protein
MWAFRLGIGIAAILVVSTAAEAKKEGSNYSKAVQQVCRADYKTYCGEYGLETSASGPAWTVTARVSPRDASTP